jgi:tetrahydromethanopterin S-methyltransferase subunit E
MLDRIKAYIQKGQELWNMAQDIVSVKGGLWVDMFAIVTLVRLLAPLKGYPGMSIQEAAIWGTTIGAFAISKGGSNGKL